MKLDRRRVGLFSALVASVIAAAWVEEAPLSKDDEIVGPVRVALQQSSPQEVSGNEAENIALVNRGDLPASDIDPFRSKSWYVAPPPPAYEPPPKPTAPPLPFQYMGMFEDQGKAIVYLAKGNESFSVSAGERFADAYQLEKIERGVLTINYLPLSIRQTLSIGYSE